MRYSRYLTAIATACAFAFMPFISGAVTTNTIIASTTKTLAPSVGMVELKKAIVAKKARLGQLVKRFEPTPGIVHFLHKGSSGDEVRLLQQFLELYASSSAPAVTGYFGTQTRQAVKAFQQNESIDPVGVVGPKTRARIRSLSTYEIAEKRIHSTSTTALATPDITDAILSTDVGEDGSGVGSTTVFASTTRNIYAILTLANAKQDTEIGFIRYYRDHYVDSAVSHPSRSGLHYLHFQWSLKEGAIRTSGSYTITFYVNGKKSKSITFIIN